MTVEKGQTREYEVAGHRFGVTALGEHLKLMDNYEPFASVNNPSDSNHAFDLEIASGVEPSFVEKMRQADAEQIIIYGQTSDGMHVFVSQWRGETAGWLLSSNDYSHGRLILSGRLTKLAIDNALMIQYALATARYSTLLFHAAAVSHKGRGYMFLGPSGTGKSTHARLWLRHISGAELINDDNPVVRIGADGVAMVYGSPWSGKTPCYRKVAYPLGGIVILRQAPINKVTPLSGIQAFAALLPSISGNRSDKRIADALHDTENRLAGTVAVWRMYCLPDQKAAEVCESALSEKA